MALHDMLVQRQRSGNPIKVGVIGAGKFSSMFLSQVPRVPGIEVVGIADLNLGRIHESCATVGWPEDRLRQARTTAEINAIAEQGLVAVTDDAHALIAADCEVILEITGSPIAATAHAVEAIDAHRHVVMVSVEADVMVGPVLADRAAREGVCFSMAYGDQPALILELVDWARTVGLEVVCAGKGTRFQPEYHYSTPDTVWSHYGFSEAMVASGDYNAQMFNSFLDGTKSAIEMCAVANGSGLVPPVDGLKFPPVSCYHLQDVLKPESAGGILPVSGTVECIASEDRYKAPIDDDLRFGVFVTLRAPTPYVQRCFKEYSVKVDATGEYASLYRPYHFIGLELGYSVASVALRGEATGTSRYLMGDVATTAKRDLRPGEMLDGEGGYTVFGKATTAAESLAKGVIPMGLAGGAKVIRPVRKDAWVTYDDVEIDQSSLAYRMRKEMEDRAKRGEFGVG
jgi:predicted homoserine dehydrogenase-like protein